MEKHLFHKKAVLGSSLVGSIAGLTGHEAALAATPDTGEILVERDMSGKPHKGKVFAAIQAHLDDIPRCAAGLCAKLINEGYTGYLIRTSNDEKYGGGSNAKNVLTNEQDNIRI